MAIGTPRPVPGGVQVPLVVRDGGGREHRLTLTLKLDGAPAGGGTR